jgi:hypothetical protein
MLPACPENFYQHSYPYILPRNNVVVDGLAGLRRVLHTRLNLAETVER